MVLNGCLLFTWANRSVHGLGKWQAKFRTSKSRPGIAFTICRNHFHTPKNGRESLELVWKKALKKWNTNFRLKHPDRGNRTTFSDLSVAPGNFPPKQPEKSCFIYFLTWCLGNFLCMVKNQCVCVCFSRWLVIRVGSKWPANRKFVRTNGGHLGRTVDRPLFWALNISS